MQTFRGWVGPLDTTIRTTGLTGSAPVDLYPGTMCAVYTAGTTTLATILPPNSLGGSMPNPFLVGADGAFAFQGAASAYDLVFSVGLPATTTVHEAQIPTYTNALLPSAGLAGRLARVSDGTPGLVMDSGDQWAPVSPLCSVREFGAVGDGVTDDTAAFVAWLAAGASHGYVSAGTYAISTGLTQPATMAVEFAPGAVLKATASMAVMWDTAVSTLTTRGYLRGATFDCNSLATTALYPRYFAHFTLTDITVRNSAGHAVILGDSAAANSSFEAMVANLNVHRDSANSVPASSYALWMRNVTDSEVTQAILVGNDVGVRNDGGSNKFTQVHAWGYSGKNPSVCFDDNSAGLWVSCYADTPTTYGWRLRQNGSRLLGGGVFNGTFGGADNTITGVFVDPTSPTFTILGVTFQGADGSHRIAKAIDHSTSTGGRHLAVGNVFVNVVTHPNDVLKLESNTSALVAMNSSASVFFNVNGGSKAIEVPNAGKLIGYSGNFSGQTWQVDSNTGAVSIGAFATGSRPTVTITGTMIYDTTLGKPVWWNGSAWKDAAGTTV